MSDLKEAMAPKPKPFIRYFGPGGAPSPDEQKISEMGNKLQSDLEKAFEGSDVEVRRNGNAIVLDKKRTAPGK